VAEKHVHACNILVCNKLQNYKQMKKAFSFLFALLILGMVSCQHGEKKKAEKTPPPLTEEQLINLNRKLLRQEKRAINAFITAHHWKMKETGTGLHYQCLHRGTGTKAHTGQLATIRYSVKLFDGQQIYSGTKTFKIGFGGVESGLEEAILLMKKGGESRFILPSHLAYGLSGDGNKIPPHTPIIYHVKLLNLK
jgi:FKBP-type peptidyl-prolyl cis-trans isomerase FkpA